jgi:Flp pilus assembly protein TadD
MPRSLALLLFALLAGCAASNRDTYSDPFEDSMNAAATLRDNGEYNAAVVEYREAIRLKPASAEAHNNLGSALFNLGDTDGAIMEFQRALLLNKDLAAAHNNMGSALLAKGNAAEAVGYFRRAVQLKPEMTIARFNLCLGLENLRQFAAALLECELLSVTDPDIPGLNEAINRLRVSSVEGE